MNDSTNLVSPDVLYSSLSFDTKPLHRPFIYINMVMSIDGKITLDDVGGTSDGLGSSMDRIVMHRLEELADCVMIGAQTLRSGRIAYPPALRRAIVTSSGQLPMHHGFFTKAEKPAIVFAPRSLAADDQSRISASAELVLVGDEHVDLAEAVRRLADMGVSSLLCEGGGHLNYEMFKAGIVDELFLTLAPWIKGGAHIPTPVEGDGFAREAAKRMELVSVAQHQNELYLRYRRVEP